MVQVNPSDNVQTQVNPSLISRAKEKIKNIFSSSETGPAQPSEAAERVRNSNMGSKEVGIELVAALNSKDKELIVALLDKINVDNASTVYKEYYLGAQELGERAGSAFAMRGASRVETLLQGIINNKELSNAEKIKYINDTMDKMYEHAKKYKDSYQISDSQLAAFQDGKNKNVENAVIYSHNASVLETSVIKVYNW